MSHVIVAHRTNGTRNGGSFSLQRNCRLEASRGVEQTEAFSFAMLGAGRFEEPGILFICPETAASHGSCNRRA